MAVLSPAEFAANIVELEPLRALDAVVVITERSGRGGLRVTHVDDRDPLHPKRTDVLFAER